MKDYSELPQSVQLMLENEVQTDPYGLRPSTLYKNIMGTLQSSSIGTTAEIFEVSLSLVEMLDTIER